MRSPSTPKADPKPARRIGQIVTVGTGATAVRLRVIKMDARGRDWEPATEVDALKLDLIVERSISALYRNLVPRAAWRRKLAEQETILARRSRQTETLRRLVADRHRQANTSLQTKIFEIERRDPGISTREVARRLNVGRNRVARLRRKMKTFQTM